jgi:hypothetical protein
MVKSAAQIKSELLGSSFSSAYQRMLKNILYDKIIVANNIKCMRCGEEMSREDFSIDHIEQWRAADNPFESMVSSDNCDFSHLSCNTKEGASRRKLGHGTCASYNRGCRCDVCKNAQSIANKKYHKKNYSKEKRRKRYENEGR